MLDTPYARTWDSIVAPGAGFAIDLSLISGLPLGRRLMTSQRKRSSRGNFQSFSDEELMRPHSSADRFHVSRMSTGSRSMATTRDIVQGAQTRSMPLPAE